MQMIRSKRCAGASLGLLLLASAGPLSVHPLEAHGTEARRVVSLSWPKERITRVLAANAPGHIGDEHPDKDKVSR